MQSVFIRSLACRIKSHFPEPVRGGTEDSEQPAGAVATVTGRAPGLAVCAVAPECGTAMLRGYEVARILESEGWSNVRVMEGGILAWPFFREK